MEGNEMSLTPMIFFRGESVCTCCDKPMYANDVGIVFVPSAKRDDIMFCTDCAVKVTMSVTQDIAKLSPDIGLSYYFKFKNPSASSSNLRRHANALKKLALSMEDQASSMASMHHPDEDK
jgi:hypothetical protein